MPEKAFKEVIGSFRTYWLEDISFSSLLLILLFGIFVLPVLIEQGLLEFSAFGIFLNILFFVGIWSARTRKEQMIAAFLFSAHLILYVIRIGPSDFAWPVIERLVSLGNILFFIYINLRLLFRDKHYNLKRVTGAVNVYLLLALMGATAYQMIQETLGNTVEGNIALSDSDEDFIHFIYFSLVSLTTVGYGDMYPGNFAARMVSVFLSAVGILYPAVIIARLIGSVDKKGEIK